MSEISRLNATPRITSTTSYERNQSVVVTNELRRQSGAETAITTKTTTSELREITETKRELEAQINALNQQLQKANQNEAQKRSGETETKSPQPTKPEQGVVLENAKRFVKTIANAPENENGRLLNAIV
ncbi:MAG: hypothetical protein A2511_13905 [Deltaproteobacteria bacterium RIFOXYD12_FULL_50_9]|nr:MAG: hypothetical protein A2511_13905 [Deltaproteobacteria bacterium RIFOXYD12_FULL_50_9]